MLNETVNLSENGPARALEGYLKSADGGTSLPLDGIMIIGRDHTCDLRVDDPFVSSRHCQLEKRPTGFFIRDLKSRNGVILNGSRVAEAELIDGAEVRIGSKVFVFNTSCPDRLHESLPLKSRNQKWMTQLKTLPSIATADLPVFLQGASGTGKEVLAHVIHDYSGRSDGPFVSVNCSALTETLVESELFGHVKGSFTGATGDRKGAFEGARGGTLFLDEIGDLPLSLQPKLLRALENQEIRPVGSDKTTSTDVRIVTATHKNLEQLVSEGKFRADLYFRIHVVKISIPSLRDRMEDFEDLLYHFCREQRVRFSAAAIAELRKHPWPGNIRELKNTVARAKALFPQIQILPEHIGLLVNEPFQPHLPEIQLDGKLPLLKEVEKEMIRARLLANNGNQRKTAAQLGMPKSTLHDRIKLYNIDVKPVL